MSSGRNFSKIQRIKHVVCRGIIIGCLATTITATLTFVESRPVAAAPVAATTVRQDRRPDRERPVTTSQGSSSQSSSSTTQARPRLVRR